MESAPCGIVITDRNACILRANAAFQRLCGYSEAELIGLTPALLSPGGRPDGFYEAMWAGMLESGHWSGEVVNRRKDGVLYTQHLTIRAIDDPGSPARYVGFATDITAHKTSAERIHYLAHHDSLTGLPNRALLHDRLGMAIEYARRHGSMVGVMFLDLDRFKVINDTLGHATGDALLVQVAHRLRHAVRGCDTVCRLGGDEFIVLLSDVGSARDCAAAARHVLQVLSQPFDVLAQPLQTSTSIGMALYPQDGSDAETLLKHADVAMYAAKRQGRNRVVAFAPELNASALHRARIESDLRRALAGDEFFVVLQPQVDLRSGRCVGVEALVRWQHPERGLLTPGEFIEVAEECGLIIELERHVMKLACAAHAGLLGQAGVEEGFRLAVNVSPPQFCHEGFCDFVEQVLQDSGLAPRSLEIEVTERLLLDDAQGVLAVFHRLAALGVAISIDDFGTGYSSLSYLQRFPVQRLKMDMSFVHQLTAHPGSQAICRAVVQLGHSLGMEVVAEGVQTPQQARILSTLGCDLAQGFLYARPMPAQDLLPWLAAGKA